MSRRKYARAGIAAVAAIVAAAIAVPALAGGPPTRVTQPSVGTVKFVPNRSMGETYRFKKDRINVAKGGTVTLVDRSKAPHSFSLVRRNQVPTSARAVGACFERGACGQLAVDHGFIDPATGEEREEPTTPLVDKGKAGFNQAGDSVLIPPGGRARVKVTSAQALYYICGLHPWMNGAINGAPVR